MNLLTKIILFISTILMISCFQNQENLNEQKIEKLGYSELEVIIERGAFHYDKFVLKDTVITFLPAKTSMPNHPEYNDTIVTKISKKIRNAFIDSIMSQGIMKMDTLYENNTSCNSHLTIHIINGNTTKKITSYDFKRGCPPLLQFIENEIVRLHGKGLKRVVLPG